MSGAVVGGPAGVPGDGGVCGRGALQSPFQRLRQPAGHGSERAPKSKHSAETKGNNLRNNMTDKRAFILEHFSSDVY